MFKIRQINFFCLGIIVLLILSNCVYPVQGEEPDRIITITADENKLYNYLSIGGFMESCREGQYPHKIFGESDDINLILELNLDQEKVTGTLSGSGSDTKYSYTYENHWDFSGSISGSIKQVLTGSWYHWKVSGTADITLHCIGMLRCYNDETESYETNTEEQNIVFSANITASSYTNSEGGFGQFGIHWSDNGGIGGNSRSFYINCGPTSGSECSLTDELPDPINLSISLNGPERIDKGTTSAMFTLNPSGRDQDLVDQVWYHFYYENPDWKPDDVYSYEWIWFENYFKDDFSDLTVSKQNMSKWLDLVDQYGTTIDGIKQLVFKLEVSVEDENGFTLVYHDPTTNVFPNMTFICSNTKTNRYQLLGLSADHPMKHISVILTDENDDIDYKTSTDENGYFILPEMNTGIKYNLIFEFDYTTQNQTYFTMFDTKNVISPNYPISLKITILNDKIKAMDFYASEHKALPSSGSLPTKIYLSLYLNSQNGLLSYVKIYHHIAEALEFYKEFLKEEISYKLPIHIFTFTNPMTDQTSYRWGELEGENAVWIQIDGKRSRQWSEWHPISEYHEFSHYMMHNLYKKMPSSPLGNITDENHGGYINPTTADSYSEGFAEFMSVIIANHYQRWWIENPAIRNYTSLCTGHGSLEINNVVWGCLGKEEEWAVAGVLWDLYDGSMEAQANQARLQQKCKNEYQKMLADFDMNADGILDKSEFITCQIIYHYDIDAVDKIPRGTLVQMMGELVTPFKGSDKEVLSNEEFLSYENNNPLLVYDTDNNNDLDENEFLAFLNTKEITDSDEKIDFFLGYIRGYDINNDLALSGKELTRIAAGEDLLKETLQNYDADKNGYISRKELNTWVTNEGDKISRVCYKRAGTSASDLDDLPEYDSLPEIISLEYVLNNVNSSDDDAVDLSFDEIWSVLRTVHDDFTSVYHVFISTYPSLKEEIDAIFINHGFFIELNKGDGRLNSFQEPFRDTNKNSVPDNDDYFIDYPIDGFCYDDGEVIGSAGDYLRQQRRSFEPLAGHYIKTNNQVPFYNIDVNLYDSPLLFYAFPSNCYEYRTINEDGSIYVPMPPARYGAKIEICGVDVETGSPLVVSGEDFYQNYNSSVNQGYYLSHDFEISGEIPNYPVDPFTVPSDSSISGKDTSSPGFGIMILICALFFIFFFKRKAKK